MKRLCLIILLRLLMCPIITCRQQKYNLLIALGILTLIWWFPSHDGVILCDLAYLGKKNKLQAKEKLRSSFYLLESCHWFTEWLMCLHTPDLCTSSDLNFWICKGKDNILGILYSITEWEGIPADSWCNIVNSACHTETTSIMRKSKVWYSYSLRGALSSDWYLFYWEAVIHTVYSCMQTIIKLIFMEKRPVVGKVKSCLLVCCKLRLPVTNSDSSRLWIRTLIVSVGLQRLTDT